ncbi:hypothetical protein CAPTEDRAFT_196846 [Capitella teleta]|uniref:CCHC-type domain-containing protein n=2 Tax=Capitella teleta TaxID=283909 RepID=R7VGE7_CAPTE|nr:hypothetical protein CAPTEDRAFT_196846 [Capitella teleta]|eukprot:ELU17923.1 hypothetical protein CAPTEDRAFT_196846 [Capitella teleta]
MDQEAALRTQAEIAARNERRQIILNEINKVTKCDGSDPTLVRQWIQEIQLARGLPDNAAAIELISGSTCGAFKLELEAFLAQQPNRDAVLWEDIRTHLLQCFVSADHAEFHRGLLTKVRQQPGENILAYNRRFRQAALEAFPGDRNADQNRELVRIYGKGLLEAAAARKLVTAGWPATLEEAFNRMSARETAQERYQHLGRHEEAMEVAAYSSPPATTPRQPQEQPQQKKSEMDALVKKLDQVMTKLAKLEIQSNASHRESPTSRSGGRSGGRDEQRCYRCQGIGHIARYCPSRGGQAPNGGQAPKAGQALTGGQAPTPLPVPENELMEVENSDTPNIPEEADLEPLHDGNADTPDIPDPSRDPGLSQPITISILCGYGVRTLNIAPVPDGVVLFGKERLLRENGQVTVFAVIDLDDSAFANTMAPIAEKIEGYIHDLRVDMRPEVQRLLSNRLQRVMRNSSKSNRMRRGLINFVGQVGKALFGLATEEDLTQVQTGMQQIADQTDVLISDHNKLVAIVNRVGAEQISQLNKVNELVNRTNVLHTQITAVSTYVSEIVQNISIAWTHMKFRTNVEYLISDVESRYRDFQELRNYMRDLKLSCEDLFGFFCFSFYTTCVYE